MLGSTTISTLVIVIHALSDSITPTPTCCLWVSTTTAFDTIGEVVLTQDLRCSCLRLPNGILCGVVCGCEYTSSFLLLV